MPRIEADQPVLPSVLDRLLDEDPGTRREGPKTRAQMLRALKQSVRRDLENLLNTRRRCKGWPPDLEELDRSLVDYGIPDITGASLSSAHSRQQFAEILQRVIRRYEPRFQSVKVQLLENADPLDRTLRFRIDAMLIAEPAPEPVVFDSAVQPTTGNVEVRGTGR